MSKPENPSALSLRDWFASQIIGSIMLSSEYEGYSWEAMAQDAYSMSDAMLAERSTQKADPA